MSLELAHDLFLSDTLVESPLLGLGRLDHVGFLVPVNDSGEVARLACVVGFDNTLRVFPSTVVAQELGHPVRILKAWGLTHSSCVEVFLGATPEEMARVGPHVGFRLREGVTFERALETLQGSGWRPLNEPQANPEDRMTVVYFQKVGEPVRLELCWATPDMPLSL